MRWIETAVDDAQTGLERGDRSKRPDVIRPRETGCPIENSAGGRRSRESQRFYGRGHHQGSRGGRHERYRWPKALGDGDSQTFEKVALQ